MPSKPVVLLACAPCEVGALRALVPRAAEVVTADSMDGANERLRQQLDAIVCSTQFDESRMLDLVREAHALRPEVPVLCCRLSRGRLSAASLRAATLAALALGVTAFLDLAPLVDGDAGELAAALLRFFSWRREREPRDDRHFACAQWKDHAARLPSACATRLTNPAE